MWGRYLRFLLLTGQRRTETALAHWRDIDPYTGVWVIPSDVTKSGRAHRVPLPWAAVNVLRVRWPSRAPRAPMSSPWSPGRSDDGVEPAHAQLFRRAHPKLPAFSLHDLRRTYRTGLGRLGVEPHVAELALNHALSDELARTYDLGDYWPERCAAAERWCAHVARVVPKLSRQGAAPGVPYIASRPLYASRGLAISQPRIEIIHEGHCGRDGPRCTART